MLQRRFIVGLVGIGALSAVAFASEAQTRASAGRTLGGPGTAEAAARYQGDVGFARTQANSGSMPNSRAVAVGVDRDGLSLSVSHAIAPRVGPAIASNFSLSIDRDGGVSSHHGLAVAEGPLQRSVTAGGTTSTGFGGPAATGIATGRTDPFGRVHAVSQSHTSPARAVVRTAPAKPVRVAHATPAAIRVRVGR